MQDLNPNIFRPLIDSYFPEPQASLFMGMLLGISLKNTGIFNTQVKIVGLSHLVVLSGTNISMLAAIAALFFSKFSKKMIIVITILILILFVIFVGPQAPIIRAAFMCIFTLVANLTGKKSTPIYLLILSLIFIMCIWPDWITSISLQLSYGATLGLILFSNNKQSTNKTKSSPFTDLMEYIKEEFRLSLAAQVFTFPIIFYYFREAALIAPISNLLISWTVAPIMLLGIILLIVGSIDYNIGLIPALACYGLLTYIVKTIEILASIPYIFFRI